MKKYNWNIYTLESRIDTIEKILKTEKSNEQVKLLTSDLLLLDDLVSEHSSKENYDMASLLECLQGAKECLGDISFLWKDISTFRKITKKSINFPELSPCSLSKDDILSLTHDFFKSLDDDFFFQKFMHQFKIRNNHVTFMNNDPNLNFRGHTIYLSSLSEAFIEINRNNTIDDIFTTVHEYSHATSSVINPKQLFYSKMLFSEIDTLFMEFAAADYLESIFKNGQAILNKALRHDELCYTVENIDLIIKLIEIEKRIPNGYTNNRVLKNIAKTRLNINPKYVEHLLQDPELHGEIYITGYMFMVELYNIYKNDKEKALYYLRKIIELECSSDEEYYNSIKEFGLIPNSSLDMHHHQINSDALKLIRKKKNPKHN